MKPANYSDDRFSRNALNMTEVVEVLVYSSYTYSNSRVDIIAQAMLTRLGVTNRDFMIIEPHSMGDVYHTLSLMRSFREKYIERGARLFFCCQDRATPIVKMFNVVDVTVTYAANELICESFANRYPLSPGIPIVVAPDMHANGWLGRLCAEGIISPIIAKKLILGLDLESPIHHAEVPDAVKSRAEQSAQAQGVQPGTSLIIFNHANMCKPLPVEAYEAVVKAFPGPVFTDVTKGGAVLIPGTQPIRIPFDEIITVAEISGYVLALRSGIVDLLSNARTKLFTIYPRMMEVADAFPDRAAAIKHVRSWTLANVGLSDAGFETGIFLDDHEEIQDISGHISRAFAF